MIITTDSIILKKSNQGDTSNILTIFTREYGILRTIAKGARSTKNRSLMQTDILSITNCSIYYKANTELHTLSRSEQIMPTNKIFDSVAHLNNAVFMIQSLLQTQFAELPAPEIFDFSVQFLYNLNLLPTNPFLLFLKHQLLLARNIGFDITSNGDSDSLNPIHRLSLAEQDFLDNILASNWEQLSANESEIPSKQKIKLINFLSSYFSYHLDERFKYTVY